MYSLITAHYTSRELRRCSGLYLVFRPAIYKDSKGKRWKLDFGLSCYK